MSLSRQNRARLAWAKSFLKSRWRFEDYPLDYIDQGECSPDLAERLQHKRWRLDLTNWYEMSGLGDTKEAALENAKQKFSERQASGASLCRPGIGPGATVPGGLEVVFPENQKIDNYAALSNDFISKVLKLSWAWITDESSLWDFHAEADNHKMYSKIVEIYGVDVSHVEHAKLVDIFEEIMAHIHEFPEDATRRAVRLQRADEA